MAKDGEAIMGNSEKGQTTPRPLEGIKVLEYGVFHAGPGACSILGELGAEVIKIESAAGDPERYLTDITTGGALPNGDSLIFEISNRNKKGLCLDIKKKRGREIFLKLVRQTDVFLVNLRNSAIDKLGLDYETLKQVNPKIIYASVSGYGKKGPFADMGGFDPMGQARSGMMYLTNKDAAPMLNHFAILDQATAITASHAMITALFMRERTGVGQEIQVSLYSSGIWLMYTNLILESVISADPSVPWDRHKESPCRNYFCCQDGKWLMGVHVPPEKYVPAFCRAIGQPSLMEDPRFATEEARKNHSRELIEICDDALATKTRDEWMEIFKEHGLMFGPVHHVGEVISDPQALVNEYVTEFKHPRHGKMMLPAYPVHFSAARAGMDKPAPELGEHTDVVLQELGFTDKDICELKEDKIVA